MDSSNSRWKNSFRKGKDNIEEVILNLNTYFKSQGDEFKIERLHPVLKTMRVFEKAKNNEVENRLLDAPIEKAMGLDCRVRTKGKSKRNSISLFVRYSDDFGFYIKVPKEYKDPAKIDEYLKLIQHYYVLFVLRIDGVIYNKYCGPMALKNIIDHCPHSLSQAKGNLNRLQFDYNPSELQYVLPNVKSFFTGNLVNRLKKIYV